MPMSRGETGRLAAEPVATWHRVVETAPAGRTCAEPGCGTRLSIYNSGDRCARHEHFVSIVVRPSPGPKRAGDSAT